MPVYGCKGIALLLQIETITIKEILYYYHKDGGIELDFVIHYSEECVPVECKATTGNSKSLRTVLKHPEKYHVNYCIKLGDYNIGRKENIFTIPMYMAFMLTSV